MQRSLTWILKSLWGACERWSKSDCIDLSAAFANYTLQSFFPGASNQRKMFFWNIDSVPTGINHNIIKLRQRSAEILLE